MDPFAWRAQVQQALDARIGEFLKGRKISIPVDGGTINELGRHCILVTLSVRRKVYLGRPYFPETATAEHVVNALYGALGEHALPAGTTWLVSDRAGANEAAVAGLNPLGSSLCGLPASVTCRKTWPTLRGEIQGLRRRSN